MPFRMWDESILGVNAIDMAKNHNYIVTYYYGHTEMGNCKPPLMIWCIVLFSKLLGFSELSVRLPSAIAALILCMYLFFAIKKFTASGVFGFLTVLVLVTCQGYVRNHVIRTGEYDSLLVLFSTISSINLFLAVEYEDAKKRLKHLFLFFLFLTLAVLTKGVACMMLAPGLFLYVLLRKKVMVFLKEKMFYAGLLFFIVFGVGYYFFRESINPGYLEAVWINELGGRYGQTIDAHYGSIWFYFNEIVTWQFTSYMLLFPLSILVGLKFSTNNVNRITLFSVIVGGVFLLIVSVAGTKLPHYDAPLFPYLAIITAALFYFLYTVIKGWLSKRTTYLIASLMAMVCVLSLLAKPYYDIISKVYFPKGDAWEENFSNSCRIFQDAAHGKIALNDYKLVFDADEEYGPITVLTCYKQMLKERGIDVKIERHDAVSAGEKVIVFDPYMIQLLSQKFDIDVIEHIDRYNADIINVKEKIEQ